MFEGVRREVVRRVVKSRTQPELGLARQTARDLVGRPSRASHCPVRVRTTSGDEMIFRDFDSAFHQLKLPHNRTFYTCIECSARGSMAIEKGSVTYTFNFVELVA